MQYSIVMPVYKRADILRRTLNSISNQILQPLEIIIVNNNSIKYETDKLKNIIKNFNKENLFKILLLDSPKNSGAIARNIGAQHAKGDIVAFLDSDVIIDKNYYSVLMDYFDKNEDLIAIQGVDHALIESQRKNKFLNLSNRFIYILEQFFETSLIFNKEKSFVSPSLAVAHPNVLKDFEVQSEWISTCAGLFKKELFKKYSFPKEFITYSNNEYLFFSYSIFLNEKGKMIYTSKAKYRDIQTSSGRINMIPLMYQIQVYDLFIFLKLFKINPYNLFIFIKSRFGHLLYNLSRSILKKDFNFKNIFHAIFSIFYPFLKLKLIINGDLSFYEKDFSDTKKLKKT